jgi:hypothetical protein
VEHGSQQAAACNFKADNAVLLSLLLLLLLHQQDTQDAAMKRCLTVMKEAFERCCRDAHVLDAAVGAHYGKLTILVLQNWL